MMCAAVLMLSACGNDKQATRGVDTIKSIASLAKAKLSGEQGDPAAAPDPVAMVENALRVIPDAPLQFILLESTGAFAISTIYGTNGSNVTWVSPDKRTMTLDRGMLVATRGFGSDIMSVQDGGAAGLISLRRPGRVEKTYRFLNREEKTNSFDVSCVIAAGDESIVESGEIVAQTRLMTENCTAPGGFDVTNSYWVDDAGRTVQSVQWISGLAGKIIFRRLRY
jgi:hypothetical protein